MKRRIEIMAVDKKWILYGVVMLVLFSAGCVNNPEETSTTVENTGLVLSAELDDSDIIQGETTNMRLKLSNYYSNDLKNVDIEISPLISGITYNVGGPELVEANKTAKWNIELSTYPTIDARKYSMYPVICFDYIQEEKGYFWIADGTPSEGVDFSGSDSGPLVISIDGLDSVDISDTTDLPITVRYSFDNNLEGMVPNYKDLEDLQFIGGEFRLDTVGNRLKLVTYEGSNGNKMNNNPATHECLVQSDGTALCYFTEAAGYDGSSDFDFHIKLPDEIDNEIQSWFSVKMKYRFCVKGTEVVSLNVEKAE